MNCLFSLLYVNVNLLMSFVRAFKVDFRGLILDGSKFNIYVIKGYFIIICYFKATRAASPCSCTG